MFMSHSQSFSVLWMFSQIKTSAFFGLVELNLFPFMYTSGLPGVPTCVSPDDSTEPSLLGRTLFVGRNAPSSCLPLYPSLFFAAVETFCQAMWCRNFTSITWLLDDYHMAMVTHFWGSSRSHTRPPVAPILRSVSSLCSHSLHSPFLSLLSLQSV